MIPLTHGLILAAILFVLHNVKRNLKSSFALFYAPIRKVA